MTVQDDVARRHRAPVALRPLNRGFTAVLVGASLLPALVPLTLLDEAGGPVPGLANIAGLVGGVLIWWQAVLGIRQVSALFTPDRGGAVALHAWLGSAGAFFVLLHPLMEMIADRHGLAYLVRIDFTWVESTYTSLGRIAFLMFCALWLVSTLARAAVRYRTWHYVHYLSYPLGALVFVHAYGQGTFILDLWWLRAYWLALGATFAAACGWRLAAPLLAPRYELTGAAREGASATVYAIRPRGRALRPGPGQFCHLRTRLLSRAHPLSVVRTDPDSGELLFAVRDAGPFTAEFRRLAPGATLYVDGPHGTFTHEALRGARPVVLVAGGIGVTPFVELVRSRPEGGAVLFHAVRSPATALFGAELRELLGPDYVPVPGGVPFDARAALDRLGRGTARRALFFVCGGPGFTADAVAALRAEGVEDRRLHVERFEW
ncbi:ferric reductase-like transmembrane domain-containing protein [Nocardiopsis trehalosi]|uniref:ferric reductase-like transmembrane domain-containing protein n=1 Tax=Nocardiopsis trehalosi TaxID=109329 RepID=UPI00083660C6|nr:ferredoxin reductase family protein [Nocardiopsis trehalosi]